MPRHYPDRQRSAAEIIAVHFCSDTGEVRAMVHETARFRNPSIYMWGEDYYCCPRSRQKLPSIIAIMLMHGIGKPSRPITGGPFTVPSAHKFGRCDHWVKVKNRQHSAYSLVRDQF